MTTRNFVVKNGLTVGNVVIDATSGNLTGLGNANLGNLATANFFSGDGGLLANINGANISGNINANISNANYASYAGQIIDSTQSNITSVGTLTSLSVSGNTKTGGLLTDNLYYANGTPWDFQLPGGSNTQVQFNDNGDFGGSANFTFNKTTNILAVNGNITSGNLSSSGAVIGSTLGGTLTTAAQPNVTSVGTLSSLSVSGNVDAGNVSATNVSGTITTASQTNITAVGTLSGLTISGTGSISGANSISANYVTGTLTTAAQPNITSVGTLSNLSVTGDITTNANLYANNISGISTSVTISAAGTNQNIYLKPSGTGVVDVNGATIANVATPNADSDAATKGYVDSVAQGLHIHTPVAAATTGTLATATGGTVTYNNGTSGVGATLTTTGSYTTIDGINIATVGTRVLVKNEANAAWNGIYTYTSGTVLTRSIDADTSAELGGGDFTFVQQGTVNADTGWVMTSDPPITIGTSNIDWAQFSGAGSYSAGTGLTLTGSVFSIANTTVTAGTYGDGDSVATFTVNAQGQLTAASNVVIAANAANLTGTTLSSNVLSSSLTSVGTLTGLSVSGNINTGNISTSGAVIGSTLGGSLTTNAQPNVTSVGTLSSLSVSGNVDAGNVSATNVSGTLTTASQTNITAVGTLGSLSVTGTATVGNVSTAGDVSASTLGGSLTTAAQPNVTSVGTLTGLNVNGAVSASGNITGNYIIGNGAYLTGIDTTSISNGSANVHTFNNANVTISAAGVGNVVVVTGTGIIVSGTTSVTGNITAGNVDGGNLVTANYFSGNGSSLSSITGANVTGTVANATYAGSAGTAITAGTVTTAAQPNITSVGTLSSVSVSGDANVGNLNASNISGTITTASQTNITAVGTLSSLSVSGNTTSGNVALTGGLTSARSNVSVSTNTVVDQFNPGTYRTAKYVISASGDDGYQSVEALLVHDGVGSYITIYGSVCSNVSADIIELSSNISGVSGNVAVYATAGGANVIVNLVSSYIKT